MKILKNNVKYEFLIKLNDKSEKLICFGAKGGLVREKAKLPDFPRHSWHKSFQESLIYYADPTFHVNKEIKTGWYMGTEDDWYLERIAEIISKIAANHKIKNQDILFYGTSAGGGFSSVMLSTLFKKSTTLVGNPQLIVPNHYQRPFDNIKKYCFNDLDDETLLKEYGYRFNTFDLFKREKYIPHIIYLVNAQSKRDLYKQCIPFLEELGKFPDFNNNEVEIIVYHDEDGHSARLSRSICIPLIKLVLDRNIYNYYAENDANNQSLNYKLKEYEKIIEEYKSRKIVKIVDNIKKFLVS